MDYIIDVSSINNRLKVLQTIKKYNDEEDDELIYIYYAKLKKNNRLMMILFGNGGERNLTFDYFEKFRIEPFNIYNVDDFETSEELMIKDIDYEIEQVKILLKI